MSNRAIWMSIHRMQQRSNTIRQLTPFNNPPQQDILPFNDEIAVNSPPPPDEYIFDNLHASVQSLSLSNNDSIATQHDEVSEDEESDEEASEESFGIKYIKLCQELNLTENAGNRLLKFIKSCNIEQARNCPEYVLTN